MLAVAARRGAETWACGWPRAAKGRLTDPLAWSPCRTILKESIQPWVAWLALASEELEVLR